MQKKLCRICTISIISKIFRICKIYRISKQSSQRSGPLCLWQCFYNMLLLIFKHIIFNLISASTISQIDFDFANTTQPLLNSKSTTKSKLINN